MKAELILLLALASIGITVISGNKGSNDVFASREYSRPDLPSGVFVARIYYDDLGDLESLTAYDVWEYNNIDERYLLATVNGREYQKIEEAGYSIQVDQKLTALLSTNQAPFSQGYRTVEEVYAELANLNSRYPLITELVTYGQSSCRAKGGCTTLGGESLAGFDLIAMRISNEGISGTSSVNSSSVSTGKKPIFFLLANIHAREIATTEIAMHFIDHLLLNYGNDTDITWLIDWHELWIVPVANPDGHWLVELGADPTYAQGAFYQRKNANGDANHDGVIDCPIWPPSSSVQYGVDLNRNHSFAWGENGSSSDPCSQIFRGSGPASESEVSFLQTLIHALVPDQRSESFDEPAPQSTNGLLISLHSFGNLILWPWGNTSEQAPNHVGLKAIGDQLAGLNNYLSCQASTCLYLASGTSDDWAYGELGIPAFTFEIGDWFMPEYGVINESLWPRNRPALLYAAKIARTPYETVMGPGISAISATLDRGQEALVVTAIADDRAHGGDQVMSASYTIDLPPWSERAELRSMLAADGQFDEQLESVMATIPLANLTPEGQVLYVTSRDEHGHRGLASSMFIDIEAMTFSNTYIPLALRSTQ